MKEATLKTKQHRAIAAMNELEVDNNITQNMLSYLNKKYDILASDILSEAKKIADMEKSLCRLKEEYIKRMEQ